MVALKASQIEYNSVLWGFASHADQFLLVFRHEVGLSVSAASCFWT